MRLRFLQTVEGNENSDAANYEQIYLHLQITVDLLKTYKTDLVIADASYDTTVS